MGGSPVGSSSTTRSPSPPPARPAMNSYSTVAPSAEPWMSSRPHMSPLKTVDAEYARSSSFYSAAHGHPQQQHQQHPHPHPHQQQHHAQQHHDATPRQYMERRPSYPYQPAPSSYPQATPLGGGSPSDDHWSPASYSPGGYSYPAQHAPPPPPPSSYPAAVPLSAPVPSVQSIPSHIPMPVPLGQAQPRRRGKLPKATTEYLKDWLHKHSDHPYPTEDEKKRLCAVTGLSMSQVSNWMINARRRILAPQRANATPATTTTPYGAAPAPYPPQRQNSQDYSSAPPAPYPQTLPPLPQPTALGSPEGGSPPHWQQQQPLHHQQQQQQQRPLSQSPPMLPHYFTQQGPQHSLPSPTDGTISRGSPHSTHSDTNTLPPVLSLPQHLSHDA